jgi:polyphosphate kinase
MRNFANWQRADIYLGSADWMPRNLYERVEVMFSVKDSTLRNRIFDEIPQTYLKDNEKSRILHPDGTCGRVVQAQSSRSSRNGNRFSAQAFIVDPASIQRKVSKETKSAVDELQNPRSTKRAAGRELMKRCLRPRQPVFENFGLIRYRTMPQLAPIPGLRPPASSSGGEP